MTILVPEALLGTQRQVSIVLHFTTFTSVPWWQDYHMFTLKLSAGVTLYAILELCAMCAGAIYWANIGRVVYRMTEKRLL